MQITSTYALADHAAFTTAVANAQRRALHSFFDQHVIEEDGAYITIDEGDYDALPLSIIDRVVHTVPGAMTDEY